MGVCTKLIVMACQGGEIRISCCIPSRNPDNPRMHTENAHAYQTGLFRHSLLLLFATQIGGAANLLFQMVMMRSLTTEEYGVLATMLSLILVFVMPLEALRTTVAHQAGLVARMNRPGNIRRLVRRWAYYLLGPSALILVLGWGGGAALADFFQMPSAMPVLATAVIIAGVPFMQMCVGALQGMQAFVWMSLVGQGWGLIRLVVGVAFVTLVARSATAGLSAHALGVGVAVAAGLMGLRRLLKGMPAGDEMDFGGMRYFLMSLLILSGYAVLSYADVMLVKRFFDPAEAGLFAKAATMGRTIIFITVPIAMAMFPKVISTGLTSITDRRVFKRALLMAVLLVAATALAVSVLAQYIWLVFTGDRPDEEAVFLIRAVVWAMAPLGVTLLLVNFELAQRRFHIAGLLPGLAVLYIVGVNIWHDTLLQVVAVLAVISVSSLILLGVDVLFRGRFRNAAAAH